MHSGDHRHGTPLTWGPSVVGMLFAATRHFRKPLPTKVQWSEDVIKADPFLGRSRVDSACAPGFRTQSHVTTSLSTGGGPVSCVQLSEGGFQVVYPLGLWSRSSGVVKFLHGYG